MSKQSTVNMQAWTTPAYDTNSQQNGVPAWANRSEIQQKQITEERRLNSGLKNTFWCKLSGAGTERERERDRQRNRDERVRETVRQRERETHTTLL